MADKKQWYIRVSQNGWEYSGSVTVTSVSIERVDERTFVADGVRIEMDEECEGPYELDENGKIVNR